MLNRKRLFGFSLVEMVIVMVIIGVIAAIAIPRMSHGAKGPGEAALVENLAVLRNAVELYAAEHDGVYPGATDNLEATFVAQLTQYTDANGNTSTTKDATHLYGPYLRKGIPACPVGANKGSTAVTVANADPAVAGTSGWVFNTATGELIVNSSASNDAGTKTHDRY